MKEYLIVKSDLPIIQVDILADSVPAGRFRPEALVWCLAQGLESKSGKGLRYEIRVHHPAVFEPE